jgi:hypothetical protein
MLGRDAQATKNQRPESTALPNGFNVIVNLPPATGIPCASARNSIAGKVLVGLA